MTSARDRSRVFWRRGPVMGGRTRPLLGVAALVIALVAIAAPSRADLELSARGRSRAIKIDNSREGRAILSTGSLAPGGHVTGEVVLRKRSRRRAVLWLEPRDLTDRPGPNGGSLSSVLRLLLEQPDAPGGPRVLYDGRLDALRRVSLGRWKGRVARTYRFTVTMPDRGAPPSATGGDNAFQGSSASVTFVWSATRR